MDDGKEKNVLTEKDEGENVDLKSLNLSDCDVPIGCPLGLDPAEDVVPNHH